MNLSNITYTYILYVFQGHLSMCHWKAVKSFHDNIHYKSRHNISGHLRNDAALQHNSDKLLVLAHPPRFVASCSKLPRKFFKPHSHVPRNYISLATFLSLIVKVHVHSVTHGQSESHDIRTSGMSSRNRTLR